MSGLLDRLLALPGSLVYALVAALVFAEDALFVGFVVPGETAAMLGGVAAALGHVSLTTVVVLVVLAAVLGDSVGYEIGHHLGPRLTQTRVLRRHTERLDRARGLLAARGGRAVFLGRFVAFFRAVMPALAGAAHMPYRRFLLWNAAGGLVWGSGWCWPATSPETRTRPWSATWGVAPRSVPVWSSCWRSWPGGSGRPAGTGGTGVPGTGTDRSARRVPDRCRSFFAATCGDEARRSVTWVTSG
ncbi:DedA family protein [Plantactinospora sp. KBS50]|uniref:DedA family protein n=1 Tax=Plantactinospora sp. KBS50 TaxID=2024580 RepID=UPI0018E03F44|nr:DedA family protein [Plantactinospora sp. KBS50]